MISVASTVSSCRRNYLRRMHRLGAMEIDTLRTKVLRAALSAPTPVIKHMPVGWSNCRLCDVEYKIRGQSFLKGFAIVRCPSCGVWQRART